MNDDFIEKGYIYLFKCGKIEKKLVEQLDEINNTEICTLENNCISNNSIAYYQNYLKDGYAIIDAYKNKTYTLEGESFNDVLDKFNNNFILDCFLPEELSISDANNFYNLYWHFIDKYNLQNKEILIKNLWQTPLGLDYCYFIGSDNYTNMINTCCTLLKSKIKNLNDKETIMFDYYKNFNLESVLLENSIKMFPEINNNNSALGIITKDDIYFTNNHKRFHQLELNSFMKKKYNEDTRKNNLIDITLKHDDIIIQLRLGQVFIWLTENINDCQRQNLLSFVNKVIDINNKEKLRTGRNTIFMSGAICYDRENIHEINDLQDYLKDSKKTNIKLKCFFLLKTRKTCKMNIE